MMNTEIKGKTQQLIDAKNLKTYEGALRAIENLRSGTVADFQFFLANPCNTARPNILEQAKTASKVTKKEFAKWTARYQRIHVRAIA